MALSLARQREGFSFKKVFVFLPPERIEKGHPESEMIINAFCRISARRLVTAKPDAYAAAASFVTVKQHEMPGILC